jgi:hypothetical protein
LAKFGQSNVPPSSKANGWNVIPDNPDVPREWRGLPIAFMVSDFQFFFQKTGFCLHTRKCVSNHFGLPTCPFGFGTTNPRSTQKMNPSFFVFATLQSIEQISGNTQIDRISKIN